MMPVSALWALVGGLALLAFGLVLKVAEISHGLKRSNDEALSLKSKIDALKNAHDKEISDIKELHSRKVEELNKKIARLNHENTPKDNPSDDLSDEETEILRLVSIAKLSGSVYSYIDRDDLCRKSKLSPQRLQYFLDRLGIVDCLKYNLEGGICGLSTKGREILYKKGLLS